MEKHQTLHLLLSIHGIKTEETEPEQQTCSVLKHPDKHQWFKKNVLLPISTVPTNRILTDPGSQQEVTKTAESADVAAAEQALPSTFECDVGNLGLFCWSAHYTTLEYPEVAQA